MAKAWDLIFVGEGGSVAAAGFVAAHRQHCGVVVPANASGGCRGFHAVYLLCFFSARVCVSLFVSHPHNGDSRRLPSVRLDGEFGHSSCALSQNNQQ